jgi:hypothetical protein
MITKRFEAVAAIRPIVGQPTSFQDEHIGAGGGQFGCDGKAGRACTDYRHVRSDGRCRYFSRI